MSFVQIGTPLIGDFGLLGQVAFGSSNTAGNCLLAFVAWDPGFGTFEKIVDSQSNTWTQITGTLLDYADGSTPRRLAAVFAAFNCKAGSNTVTALFNSPGAHSNILCVVEYSGVGSVDVCIGGAAYNAGAATATTGSVNTGANGDTIVGFFCYNQGTVNFTVGSGFTIRTNQAGTPSLSVLCEDKVQSTAGSTSATASLSGGTDYIGFMIALRPTVTGKVTLDAVGGGDVLYQLASSTYPMFGMYGAMPKSDISTAQFPLTVGWSHTCSGSNRAIVVAAAFANATGSDASITLSATYGGISMTTLGTQIAHPASSTSGFVQLFGLVNPPSGTYQVCVTASGSGATGRTFLLGGSTSFNGVHQTTPFGTPVVTPSSVDGSTISTSVTTASSNNMVVDAAVQGSVITTSTQQMHMLNNYMNISRVGCLASSTAYATGGSVTMSYTCKREVTHNFPDPSGSAISDSWAIIAVEVNRA